MIKFTTGFYTLTEFARRYVGPKARKDSFRAALYQMIENEIARPNSTPLDIIVIGGHTLIKYRRDYTNLDLAAIENPHIAPQFIERTKDHTQLSYAKRKKILAAELNLAAEELSRYGK